MSWLCFFLPVTVPVFRPQNRRFRFSAASKNYFFCRFFISNRCWHVVCLCVLGKFWQSRIHALKSCSWSTCIWLLGGCKNEASIIDEKIELCSVLMLDNKRKIFAWLLYLLHASNKSEFSMIDVSQSTTTLNASVPVCQLWFWCLLGFPYRPECERKLTHVPFINKQNGDMKYGRFLICLNLHNIIREVQVFGFCTACIA